MKAVIQRVTQASVLVRPQNDSSASYLEHSKISKGIFTLLGIEKGDTIQQTEKIIQKILDLRIFEDENHKMNLSLKDIGGEHLIVSQFTLAGDTSQGRRPSFLNAEKPDLAVVLYEYAIQVSKQSGIKTESGIFQSDMQINLSNDGPCTFIL